MDGKLVKNQQQQWGFVKEETFSSDHHQFEWPAKNYSCNFCRREFKSAQALGGHMNVHRRDRARLRLLPSWMPADNSYPNPNLSLSSAVPPFIINSVSFIEDQDHHHKKLSPNSSTPQDHDHDYEVLHVLKKKKTTSLGNFEGSNSNEDLDLELHL